MALAPYFGRVGDALTGATTINRAQLDELLINVHVQVAFHERTADDPALSVGAHTLTNLLARLYPRLHLSGPDSVTESAAAIAESVNPEIDIEPPYGDTFTTIDYGGQSSAGAAVACTARGWTVYIDEADDETGGPPSPLTAIAASCFTAAELFRTVFADHLGPHARRHHQPGQFSLTQTAAPATVLDGLTLPPAYLAGAGAIGQAAVHALAASGASGHLTIVDPETVELSNLQRYLLATVDDIGARKVDLAAHHLPEPWTTGAIRTQWGADERTAPGQPVVLVALDTARDRLGVAAGLHKHIYNAWTQPDDLGWSRHELFGQQPCLACLYYPRHPTPSDDELIAAALGQHRLRALSYLMTRAPIGQPLPDISAAADVPPPSEAAEWLTTPLLADLITQGVISSDDAAEWSARTINDLYSEGICGGGVILPDNARLGGEVTVPLAHQSVLAGTMLAFEFISAHQPELREARGRATEHRLDLCAGLPQVDLRPRTRTPGCICSDSAYLEASRNIRDGIVAISAD